MCLDNDGAPGGGGGDKPDRVELVTPHMGVLLQLTPRFKLFNVGLSCCAKDATDDEVLEKFRSIFHEDDKVKWTEVVREGRHSDEDYNRLLPICCDSDPDRLHLVVLATVSA